MDAVAAARASRNGISKKHTLLPLRPNIAAASHLESCVRRPVGEGSVGWEGDGRLVDVDVVRLRSWSPLLPPLAPQRARARDPRVATSPPAAPDAQAAATPVANG